MRLYEVDCVVWVPRKSYVDMAPLQGFIWVLLRLCKVFGSFPKLGVPFWGFL